MHVLVLVVASLMPAVPQPVLMHLPVVKAVHFGSGQAGPSAPRREWEVVGGKEAVGWIELSAPAVCVIHCDSTYLNGKPAGGMNILVSSSNPSVAKVPVPGIIFFHVGDTRENLTVLTSGVSASTDVTISGWREGSAAQTATLEVSLPSLTGLTIDAPSVVGGATAHGTLTFNGTAAGGAVVVKVSSSSTSAVKVPQSVSLESGKTAATFDLKTGGVASNTAVDITSSFGDQKKIAAITVQPATLTKFDGDGVHLSGIAPPSGALVALSSADPAHASVPQSVTVAGGSDKALVTVTNHRDYEDHHIKLSASLNGITKTYDDWVMRQKKPDMYVREVALLDRGGNAIPRPQDSQAYKMCVTLGLTGVDIFETITPKATTLHVAYLSPTGTGTSAGHEWDMPLAFSNTYNGGWRYKTDDETHWWYQPPTCIDMPGLPQSGAYTDVTLVINPNHNNPEETDYGNNARKQRITRQ